MSDNRYAYCVCQMQSSRITFVNGEWQGTLPMAGTNEAMATCPLVWDYLRGAGDDGWELVSTVATATYNDGTFNQFTNTLFLRKSLS